ncbi:MAG TPA: hypothetical protein VIF34_11360 [Methylocystis sp.]
MPGSTHDRGLPPRVAARPDPALWGEDELLTLREASALFWPQGPLTERSLRTAVRDGRLPVSMVARKLLTTPKALRELSSCVARPSPIEPATAPAPEARPSKAGRPDRDAAYTRLMRRLGADTG